MLHVPDIGVYTAFHLMQFLSFATEAGDLCPTGDAWLYAMAYHVVVYQLGVFFGMLNHVRTRAYQRHVAQEYVDELGEFVDVGLAHEISELRLARIVLGSLYLVGILVYLHAAKLEAPEFFSVDTVAFLFEENRSWRGNLDNCSYNQVNEREYGEEEQSGNEQVKSTFDDTVVYIA